jgi:hypothetical protein
VPSADPPPKRLHVLPAHVFTCAVQDQVFFLDLRRNRYLSTSLRELRGLSRFVEGWPRELQAGDGPAALSRPETEILTAVTELSQRGLLIPSTARNEASLSMSPSQHPVARESLIARAAIHPPRVTTGLVLTFLMAAAVARYRLSLCSLYSTAQRIERRRMKYSNAIGMKDLSVLQHLVSVFRRLRPLLPPTRVPCMLGSLALLEFLAAYRQFPRLVFGVQAHPFTSHCWLQHEDVLLNATLEETLPFTPIMVV